MLKDIFCITIKVFVLNNVNLSPKFRVTKRGDHFVGCLLSMKGS